MYLCNISERGFNTKITASVVDKSLHIAAHSFDTEGYERERDIKTAADDFPAVCNALGLDIHTANTLLSELARRFTGRQADEQLADFLKEAGIETEASGYSRFPSP